MSPNVEMKKLFNILAILFLAFFCISSYAKYNLPAPANKPQSLDQIVAIVNSEIITQREIDHDVAQFKNQLLSANVPVPSEQVLKQQILQRLINIKLQMQLAKRFNVTVTDQQVTASIANIAQRNNLSVDQLLQKVTMQGYTQASYRAQIQKQLILQKVQRMAIGKDITVTNADIDQYLASYKKKSQQQLAYHVLDLLTPDQATAAKAMSELKAGADFTKVAAHYQLNDLGWRTLTNLPDLFAKQIPAMKINGIAGPLKAPNGYHLLKLIGTRAATAQTPPRAQVRLYLIQHKFLTALNKWLAKLRQASYIHIIVPQ